ncbi:hypothetical protein [Mesorhizobium marinum]|uniref:Uncharacterized protein n=1 Tax=Mesorhizobium marinum TaxID=3228790 RepID=A0ABV3QWS6_9HYPH
MVTAKRLNLSSFVGPDIDFVISDENFRDLETAYRRTLTVAQRERLHWLCTQYIHLKRVEDTAETYADLERLFSKLEDVVDHFNRLAWGPLIPMSDAGAELSGLLDTHLERQSIPAPRNCLKIYDENALEFIDVEIEGPPLRLLLTASALEHVAYGLNTAIRGIASEIAELKADRSNPGFTPGEAFGGWLRTMHFWAKENGFTAGPYVNNAYTRKRGPTSFAMMLYDLNELFPEGYREAVSSPMAMADRLKVALKSRA